MKRKYLILLIVFLSLNACFYIDNESYRVDITSSYNPEILISSNLDDLDSIIVPDSLFFKYNIQIDTGHLYFADLFIGNIQIFRFDTIADSLWINPFYISQPGDYILTLAAYCKTYTQSLADIINAEFLISDTSWTIKIRRDN